MTDREKMICSIERCICRVPGACSCRDCGYNNHEYNECVEKLFQDVLKLLKEQEPIEPKTGKWITRLRHEHYPSGKPYEEDFCSECGKRGSLEYPFCPWCGKKMESGEMG